MIEASDFRTADHSCVCSPLAAVEVTNDSTIHNTSQYIDDMDTVLPTNYAAGRSNICKVKTQSLTL